MRFNIVKTATAALIAAAPIPAALITATMPGAAAAQTATPPATPAPVRPQNPVPPFPYTQVEASYDNPARPGVHLAGTLTVPKGKGPFPAVVLITGSGKQDRDESVAGHKPFLVLADYLTRRGFAVLRVDDRGAGGSKGEGPDDTMYDHVTDVSAGVDWLKQRLDVDRGRIGLIGHSEGAVIAPMVAKANRSVAFALLWAGVAVSMREVIIEQGRAVAAASGDSPETVAAKTKVSEDIVDALAAAPDQAAAHAAALKIMLASGEPEARAVPVAKLMSTAWFRALLAYDPQQDLRALRIPVLALMGGKDVQAIASQNIGPYKAALAGNRRARVMEMPGLNHLLQESETGAITEYAKLTQTIAPEALKVMGDWLAEVTGR